MATTRSSATRKRPILTSWPPATGVAANYVSVAHPSLPNYLALTGGDTFGIVLIEIRCMRAGTGRCGG